MGAGEAIGDWGNRAVTSFSKNWNDLKHWLGGGVKAVGEVMPDVKAGGRAIRETNGLISRALDPDSTKITGWTYHSGDSKNGPADAPKETETEDEGEEIEFSYNPGDTFGQKIIDLGLATDNGLWGDNGDVAYYTKQLRDQGALDAYGNVILGKTWKLKRRK